MPISHTFSPDAIPIARRAAQYQPKVLMADFGDGFSQRASPGPNSNPATVELTFEHITTAERDYIDDFLNARGGWEAFYYMPPNDAQRAFVCLSWSIDDIAPGIHTLTATFKQVYDI